jgi:hypothetical protein
MKITTLLMDPFLQQLEQEFSALVTEVCEHGSPEANQLCREIDQKKIEVRKLQLRFSGQVSETVVPAEYYEDFRKLKLDLRFMRRRWLKIISNTERLKKMYARRAHVSTVAA